MDKYEYKLKLDEMKSLTAGEQYEEAAAIADTINWHKIKNVNDLMRAGEIYENVGRYEESREILLMAYDRSPIGRRIIGHLAEIALEMGNFEEAEDYYQEFVGIAPHDNFKYVLRYKINKAKGANPNTLIQILEELKEQEYFDKWAYELITLYHKAGMAEKCIEACDELILWYGDGEYVEKALEIKMLYQPLNEQQEKKYNRFRQKKEGIVEVRPEEYLESGERVSETMRIPEVELTPERFNTLNLQKELQKGLQQIIEATEKEKIDEAVDSIRRAVEEVPSMTITKEFKIPKPEETTAEEIYAETHPAYTGEEIYALSHPAYMGMIAEEYDGQMSLLIPDSTVKETQIAGQMNIGDLIADWERAQQEADRRNLASAKEWAMQETGGIVDHLSEIIPMLDSGVTPQEIFRQYREGEMSENATPEEVVANMNQLLQQEIERIAEENARMDEELAAVGTISDEEQLTLPLAEPENVVKEYQKPTDRMEAETVSMPVAEAAAETVAETATEAIVETAAETIAKAADMAEEQGFSGNIEKRLMDNIYQEELKQEQLKQEKLKQEEIKQQEPVKEEPKKVRTQESSGSRFTPITRLSDEQRRIFSFFASVRGMEKQICHTLSGIADHLLAKETAETGNLMIIGGAGSGKTFLAKSMVKALLKTIGRPNGKVGTIDALRLNKGDAAGFLSLVTGGVLIIERAGNISAEMAEKLAALLQEDDSGLLVIIEDTRAGIAKALGVSPEFAACFSEKLQIPAFTNDQLVAFARAYAKESGYMIDEMGVLALHNSISSIQTLDHATTLIEVKEIVDSAIYHVEKGKIKKIFSIITSSRYDADNYIILHEKDFNA